MAKPSHHFDLYGETESSTTVHKLTVLCPERPPSGLAALLSPRRASRPHNFDCPDNDNTELDSFFEKHLSGLRTKVVKLPRGRFHYDFQCKHLEDGAIHCDQGCYFLEKGGAISRWRCARQDCEGHVYCGDVKQDADGRKCFGDKGKRMVCIERRGTS